MDNHEHDVEAVIDLGDAVVETKGMQIHGEDTGVAGLRSMFIDAD